MKYVFPIAGSCPFCFNKISSIEIEHSIKISIPDSHGDVIMKHAVERIYNDSDQVFTMLKDWFHSSDDGNNGIILMAECPFCGDAVVYGDGCVKCDSVFNFKEKYNE